VESFDVEASLQGGPRAAWRARRLVEDELEGRVPAGVLPDVALLVTELVANGVRHGGADETSAVDVRIEARATALHVEVANPIRADVGVVGPRAPDLVGGGGLGLHIVDRVASRWGVIDEPCTTVWFELDCSPGTLL
jgi:anti-sigma regulatory factor (Ser/Thr protein kinase)